MKWNKEIKGRKFMPEDFNFLSFLCISIGLPLAILAIIISPEFNIIILSFPLMLLVIGILVLFMKKGYREKYFPDRRFSQPVSPDGSQLEDNSEELKKQISEETRTDTPEDKRKKYKSAAVAMIASSVSYAFFKIAFGSNTTEHLMSLLALPSFFFGLSVLVTIWIFGEKKGNLKLKMFLMIFYLVSELVVSTIAIRYFMDGDSVSYLVIALTMVVSAYFVFKMAILSIAEYDKQEDP